MHEIVLTRISRASLYLLLRKRIVEDQILAPWPFFALIKFVETCNQDTSQSRLSPHHWRGHDTCQSVWLASLLGFSGPREGCQILRGYVCSIAPLLFCNVGNIQHRMLCRSVPLCCRHRSTTLTHMSQQGERGSRSSVTTSLIAPVLAPSIMPRLFRCTAVRRSH